MRWRLSWLTAGTMNRYNNNNKIKITDCLGKGVCVEHNGGLKRAMIRITLKYLALPCPGGVIVMVCAVNSSSKYRVSVSEVTWGLNGGTNCFRQMGESRNVSVREKLLQLWHGFHLSWKPWNSLFSRKRLAIQSRQRTCAAWFPWHHEDHHLAWMHKVTSTFKNNFYVRFFFSIAFKLPFFKTWYR